MIKKYMFTAKWCGDCNVVKNMVSDIPDVKIIDVEEYPELVKKYSIMSIPSYILDTGILINSGNGIKPSQWLLEFYNG